MAYLVTVPSIIRKIYGDVTWDMPATEKIIYLTFDDGPHPEETPFVLEILAKYNAKATFFCIGKNVVVHENIYSDILQQGHSTANHSFSHPDGWKTSNADYLKDVDKACDIIKSNLFRPPYGKITPNQVKTLRQRGLRTIMWTVISGDFDKSITPLKCFQNVMRYVKPGAIVVFHDSTKASVNLRHALPKVLEELSRQGYIFNSL